MNRPELWLAAAAAAPLFSYFIGRFNRWAGLACGGAVFAASAFMLAGASGAGPAAVLAAWNAAALAHSFGMNSRRSKAESPRLAAGLREAARLEKDLVAAKEEARAASAGEKRSLAVYSAVKLLSETVEPAEAAGRLGKYLGDYFETGQAALYLSEGGRLELFAQAAEARSLPALEEIPVMFGGWPETAMLKEGLVAAPVAVGGFGGESELLGIIVVRPPSAAGAAENAASFAGEIAFALRRVQLFRQVEKLSLTDGLTGLWRRGALDEKIAEEFRRASALKTPLGFMIADIDHFKRLNDTYGHQFGDAVLKRVAQLLREGVYETDFVGRYGGEEFGIVLPRADAAGVLRKAETIRARIQAETFSQGLETVKLTVSIGIAHYPRDAADPVTLVARADAALYAAKESGRNRVLDAGSIRS